MSQIAGIEKAEGGSINKCVEYCKWTVKKRIPIIEWLPKYQWKENFFFDFSAGLTITCLCVPQGLAFAMLANVDLIYGLNTCCFPAFIYALLGTATKSSFGSVAVTSMMIGQTTVRFEDNPQFSKEELVSSMTITTGIFYLMFFLIRLHVVKVIFKKPFVCGFLTALVFYIMIKSLKLVLGIENLKSHYGPLNLFRNAFNLASNIKRANVPTIIISIVVVAVFALNTVLFTPWLKKRTRFVLPIEMIVMAIAIVCSYIFEFSKMGVPLLGRVPTGLPKLTPPSIKAFKRTWLESFLIAAVNYATTVSNITVFNDNLDTEQEVLTMAVCNLVCGWFQCFIFGNSMMRTVVAYSLGVTSLMSAIVSSVLMFFTILIGGKIFSPLPKSILGSIMLTAATKLLIMRVKDVKHFRKSWEDVLIYLVTLLTTMIITIEIGLIVGLILSLRKILDSVTKNEQAAKQNTGPPVVPGANIPEIPPEASSDLLLLNFPTPPLITSQEKMVK
ncbi:solute carrier family 26 member 6-like [Cimex lectularius]|uniref:SLC26A/SulP transporter domain-containing protein n=1 Tax=Cimex lectularius TaxID=79782 RepID=A0A8I6R7H9_CIMLE|nr:solute carrier family 26 member 6-like [Cimex lectularius]